MLVHRWGVLRKSIHVKTSINKTTHLVLVLCKLHNYCIDERDSSISSPTRSNTANIVNESGDMTVSRRTPNQNLVGGGHHADDVGGRLRQHSAPNDIRLLPRNVLLRSLIAQGKTSRPKPMGSTTTNK